MLCSDRRLQEALRRDDRQPGIYLLLARHALHPAPVVDVTVRVDHAGDRALPAVRPVQAQRRRRGLRRDQWVDHDNPAVALNEADGGQVQAADLVDALGHLEQALPGSQRRLTPQARVHRVWRLTGQERVRIDVPHHLPGGVPHHPGHQRSNETTFSVGKVTLVIERVHRVARHRILPCLSCWLVECVTPDQATSHESPEPPGCVLVFPVLPPQARYPLPINGVSASGPACGGRATKTGPG